MCATASEIERAVRGRRALSKWRSDRDAERVGGSVHRELIVKLAAQHMLPAVYFGRYFVADWRPDFVWGRSL